MGMTMNFAYLLSGTTSTNPQNGTHRNVHSCRGGINAGKIGLDRWIIPYFKEVVIKKGRSRETPTRCLKLFKKSVGRGNKNE